MITSDHSGFAGVQPPEINSPPANIRSPELGYPAQLCLSMSARSIGADDHLRAEPLLPEVNTQKRSSPPTTAASPEFGLQKKAQLRPAFANRRYTHLACCQWNIFSPDIRISRQKIPSENLTRDQSCLSLFNSATSLHRYVLVSSRHPRVRICLVRCGFG
jgi:hypothetical protein